MSLLQPLVEPTRKSMVRLRSRGMLREVLLEQRRRRRHRPGTARARACSAPLVGERKLLGVRLEEEVERIEHRHLGDQVDLDAQLVGLLREDQPREVVACGSCCQLMKCFAGATFSE